MPLDKLHLARRAIHHEKRLGGQAQDRATTTSHVLGSMVIVRRLSPHEWPAYRDLRLKALRDSPDAFGSTFEREQLRSDAEWAARLAATDGSDESLPLVAVSDDEFVGLAWGRLDASDDRVAHVYQMWVSPTRRGRGIGSLLIDTLIEWARSVRATQLCLSVTCGNAPAERTYSKAGFEPLGSAAPLRAGSPLLSQPMKLEL